MHAASRIESQRDTTLMANTFHLLLEEEGQQPTCREIEEGRGGIHSQWIGLLVEM